MNKFIAYINGETEKEVLLNNPTAIIDGKEFAYKILSLNDNQIVLKINDKIYNAVFSQKSSERFDVLVKGQNFEVETLTELQKKSKELKAQQMKNSGETYIKAPMPGLLLKMEVSVGDEVTPGTSLFILEAMKMENEIKSEIPGVVKEIKATQGEAVEKGATVLIIE